MKGQQLEAEYAFLSQHLDMAVLVERGWKAVTGNSEALTRQEVVKLHPSMSKALLQMQCQNAQAQRPFKNAMSKCSSPTLQASNAGQVINSKHRA